MRLVKRALVASLVCTAIAAVPSVAQADCYESLCMGCTWRNGYQVCKYVFHNGHCDCYADLSGCHLTGGTCRIVA
jgi:hypothetical protein